MIGRMIEPTRLAAWGLALGLAMLASTGCALLTKSRPVKIRFFTAEVAPQPAKPASTAVASSGAPAASAPAPVLELRLARVNAASYLRDRIAYRDASAEVGYYATYRWADPPESYLRRALARSLFERHQLREIVSGAGPALEIDLDAFEEMRAPRRVARISITWRLRGDRTILVQRTLTVERPISVDGADASGDSDPAPAIVAALTEAMAAAVDTIVADVVSELSHPVAAPAGPGAQATR
jgi:ABC-type uncharacterized transport system auxiliary subunit